MLGRVSGWFGRAGKGTWHFALLLLCLCLFNPGAAMSQGCVTTPACKPQFKYEGLNGLVTINNCKTTNTSSSCAWANVTLQSSNFLACRLEVFDSRQQHTAVRNEKAPGFEHEIKGAPGQRCANVGTPSSHIERRIIRTVGHADTATKVDVLKRDAIGGQGVDQSEHA